MSILKNNKVSVLSISKKENEIGGKTMKKTFILEDLECAHCAAKMEEEIKKLDAVTSCSINFLTTKMVLETEDDKMDAVIKEAKKIIKRIEPDVTVREK